MPASKTKVPKLISIDGFRAGQSEGIFSGRSIFLRCFYFEAKFQLQWGIKSFCLEVLFKKFTCLKNICYK